MAEFFTYVGAAVGSAVVLALLAGAVVHQLVKRDQTKIEHNRRSTDRVTETQSDEVHTHPA